jgi:hypothetical protein
MNIKHALIMLACCLIPLVGLGAIFLFHIPTSEMLIIGMVLIKPKNLPYGRSWWEKNSIFSPFLGLIVEF